MPFYEYTCPDGHRTGPLMRRISARHDPLSCEKCRKPAELSMSIPHCPPDGVYSYAPNLGDANAFERRIENLKHGKRLMDKE
jgi:hypothetical protein